MQNLEIIPPSKVTFTPDKEKPFKALLEIEPLHPDYGYTIGNALRRVLLSSLPGAAISAVKIDGVEHEFSTIENVREDVVEIILNLKQVRFKFFADEPVRLKFEVSGKKTYTAADFQKHDQVEVVNPEQVIAEGTAPKAKLSMEVIVEKGVGFVPVEQKETKDLEIGMISIDSIFTPIRAISLNVTNARVGRMTNFDKVIMEIETDGTITPEDAIKQSGKILVDQFVTLAADLINKEELEKRLATRAELPLPVTEATEVAAENAEVPMSTEVTGDGLDLNQPVEEFGFSTRTLNALHNNDIKTIGDITRRNREELAAMQGLGGKAISEIEQALKKLGIELV